MLKFFKRRRPTPRADNRPSVAEAQVMSAWGLSEADWAVMTDFERRECRRNITAAPRFVS